MSSGISTVAVGELKRCFKNQRIQFYQCLWASPTLC